MLILLIASGYCNAAATAAASCYLLYLVCIIINSSVCCCFWLLLHISSIRTLLLRATSMTTAAAPLLLALPLARAPPLQRDHYIVHTACYGHVPGNLMWKFVRPFHSPELSCFLFCFVFPIPPQKSGSSHVFTDSSQFSTRPKDENR